MSSTNFTLYGIPSKAMMALQQEAQKQHTSVNLLILKLIERGVGFSHEVKNSIYHELDKLAGTWSSKEAKEFEKNTKDFEKIDKKLWS